MKTPPVINEESLLAKNKAVYAISWDCPNLPNGYFEIRFSLLNPGSPCFLITRSGINEIQMTTLASLMGAHVGVGLEDNIYSSKGKLASSNA
jgi:hypothetical protein